MEIPSDPLNSDEAESLCLQARDRAAGGPLSNAEVVSYLALLLDVRCVPDPDDPPTYDWCGGPAQAGGGQMQVREQAAKTLRTCGGEELVHVLQSNLFGSTTDSEREYFACLAVELLGPNHSFVHGLLRHESPLIRGHAISGFTSLGWENGENTVLLSPLLIDESDVVVAQAVAIFTNLDLWFKAVPSGTLPANVIQVATERLKTSKGSRKLRLESLALVALLTENWTELARVLVAIPADDLQTVVALECFGASAIDCVLRIEPSLRPLLKAAVIQKFRNGEVGKRHYIVRELCCFVPDSDAFELALSEIRVRTYFRSQCITHLLCFVQYSSDFMPALVEAAFERADETQSDEFGFRDLIQCNPDAFAHAIAAAPATRELRLNKLDRILSRLPSSRDGETLMCALRENLIRLGATVKKSKPRK